jgi:hypothetical protein
MTPKQLNETEERPMTEVAEYAHRAMLTGYTYKPMMLTAIAETPGRSMTLPSRETFKASFQKMPDNQAICEKIDVAALFPPQSTKAPKKRRAPKKRSLASLYWDAIDEENAEVFVDAMEASVKGKTYDQAFKIVVKSCEELQKLLYEKEYGLYDEELAESHPDPMIENTVFTFQNFFLEMAERDCPDDDD